MSKEKHDELCQVAITLLVKVDINLIESELGEYLQQVVEAFPFEKRPSPAFFLLSELFHCHQNVE